MHVFLQAFELRDDPVEMREHVLRMQRISDGSQPKAKVFLARPVGNRNASCHANEQLVDNKALRFKRDQGLHW